MTFRRPRLLRALLGTSVLLAAGCNGTGPDEAGDAGADPRAQGVDGFFNPQSGETWKYKVQKEIPLDVALAEADQARRPERTDSGYLITSERVRTCAGTKRFDTMDRDLTCMEILEDGKLLGVELYDIGPEGVFFRGWIPAGVETPDKLLDRGVKLATPDMVAGQRWEAVGADASRQFQFRVIERAALKVPAGEFEAIRIQITSEHEGKGLKRTIWFAENVGIVREETVSYGPQRTQVRETTELVHFLVPDQSPPSGESLASLPGDAPPPENDPAAPAPDAPAEDAPADPPSQPEAESGTGKPEPDAAKDGKEDSSTPDADPPGGGKRKDD